MLRRTKTKLTQYLASPKALTAKERRSTDKPAKKPEPYVVKQQVTIPLESPSLGKMVHPTPLDKTKK